MLRTLRASLFGKRPVFPDDTDWDAVIREAKEQTVMGLISPVIPVQDESGDFAKACYMRMLYEQNELVKLLDANHIPCVILKGCAAAVYYPKPYLRSMGDIDFLVPHEKFRDAMKVMADNGYAYENGLDEDGNLTGTKRHVEYMKDGLEYELHYRFSAKGVDIDDILEDAISRREYCEMNGFRVPILPEIENGLVLLGHLKLHLTYTNLGLRQVIDWAMYFSRVMNKEKWNGEFVPVLKKIRLYRLGVIMTKMCEKYLGISAPFVRIEKKDAELCDAFWNMIMGNGNFGRKAEKSLTRYEKGARSASFYIKKNGLFHYFQTVGVNRWELCKKYPVFKCFAWIYGMILSVGRGIRILLTNPNARKQIAEGKKRFQALQKAGFMDK